VLKHRFDDLPLHKLCYCQSFYSNLEVMEKLQRILSSDASASEKVDAFGMTPFRILALSTKKSEYL